MEFNLWICPKKALTSHQYVETRWSKRTIELTPQISDYQTWRQTKHVCDVSWPIDFRELCLAEICIGEKQLWKLVLNVYIGRCFHLIRLYIGSATFFDFLSNRRHTTSETSVMPAVGVASLSACVDSFTGAINLATALCSLSIVFNCRLLGRFRRTGRMSLPWALVYCSFVT